MMDGTFAYQLFAGQLEYCSALHIWIKKMTILIAGVNCEFDCLNFLNTEGTVEI